MFEGKKDLLLNNSEAGTLDDVQSIISVQNQLKLNKARKNPNISSFIYEFINESSMGTQKFHMPQITVFDRRILWLIHLYVGISQTYWPVYCIYEEKSKYSRESRRE